MCGRYYIDYEVDLVLQEIYESLFASGATEPVYGLREVFPDTEAAVLVADNKDGICPTLKRWGEKRGGMPLVINARQETITERPMFRDAFALHRCIIPASGFYEWAQSAGRKQKYRIDRGTDGPLYLAGLYLPRPDQDRYIIITRASDGDMQYIHQRSPVLLEARDMPEYLLDPAYARQRLEQANPPLRIEPDPGSSPVQLSFLDLLP